MIGSSVLPQGGVIAGILHNTATERGFEENQWWLHTVIGDGDIDWVRFLAMLHALPGGLPALSFVLVVYQYECRSDNVLE